MYITADFSFSPSEKSHKQGIFLSFILNRLLYDCIFMQYIHTYELHLLFFSPGFPLPPGNEKVNIYFLYSLIKIYYKVVGA